MDDTETSNVDEPNVAVVAAKVFAICAAMSAGYVCGALATGYAYDKLATRMKARAARKAAETE